MKALLITECLQNDFVKPLADGESLPNLLHVGALESRRLMGEDPARGPVARAMEWAYAQPPEDLAVIHLRDWHDPASGHDRAHLAHFGQHCLANSDGAAFAFTEPADARARPVVIDAVSMNDFLGTPLAQTLDPHAGTDLPVGLMGVWTEAKITFLAYELRTRYPDFRIAVCSALTASSSRAAHFNALDQLEKILGVRLYSSVAEFIAFLGGEAPEPPAETFGAKHPVLDFSHDAGLETVDEQLLRLLFRDCRAVTVKPLTGGFSGNLVLMTPESTDLHGHQQTPHVIKIGPQNLIAAERAAFERIEPVLGNSAPRIADFAEMAGRGALKYRYASMGAGPSRTFKDLYLEGLDQPKTNAILDIVFDEQLGRLYAPALRENRDLLDYYQFSARWAPGVRDRVNQLTGGRAADPVLSFPGGRTASNLVSFYADFLARESNRRRSTPYFSYVHGDLNGANIIIDSRDNVWLIDFFHTHYGHVLRDLIKLENDLLYILTPLADEAELDDALRLTDVIVSVTGLAAPLPGPDEAGLQTPALRRAWVTLTKLRSFYPGLIKEDRDPLQLFIAQLRYAVHTLGFDESPPRNKSWALYTSCRLAPLIEAALGRKAEG